MPRKRKAQLNNENRKLWAREWFAGNGYCPQCKSGTSLQTVRNDTLGSGAIDTWACGNCEHRWKVELREVSVLADADDTDSDWIEHYPPASCAEVLRACTVCVELLTRGGVESSLPQWARLANGGPDYEEIAKRGRQVLGALSATSEYAAFLGNGRSITPGSN